MKPQTQAVLIFLLLAFAPSWILWEWMIRAGWTPGQAEFQLIVLAGAFCPALASFAVRAWFGGGGFASAGLRPRFKEWKWYLPAWLLPLPVVGFICLGASLSGLGSPDWTMQSGLEVLARLNRTEVPHTPAGVMVLSMVGTAIPASFILFGEEFGWRGFLQGRLVPGNPVLDAALVGVVWSMWHLPLNLRGYNFPGHPVAGTAIFTVSCIFLSVIFGWMRERSGTVWTACLAHSATNSIGASLMTLLLGADNNLLFLSYLGILGWIPLGGLSAWIVFTGRLKPIPAVLEPGSTESEPEERPES